MDFAFRIGKTLVDYRVVFDYDDRPFEFSYRSSIDFDYNAAMLDARLATIDEIHVYRLLAFNPILWNDSSFYLDCSISFYSTTSLSWLIRLPEKMTAETYAAIEVWKPALKPIFLGTMIAHREAIHEEARQAIRDRARRQASSMHVNGDRLLRYLDELTRYDGNRIIGFNTEPS